MKKILFLLWCAWMPLLLYSEVVVDIDQGQTFSSRRSSLSREHQDIRANSVCGDRRFRAIWFC